MVYYLCGMVTLISAAVSFGFAVASFFAAKSEQSTALVNAKYALSRSASLLLVAIGLLIFKEPSFLIGLSAVMIFVQLFDGVIGIKISPFKTVGPLITAVGNTVVLILFLLNQ